MAKNILVIDDSPSMRNLIKATLQQAGHNVFTAQDGEKALKTVNSETLNLIVTDVNMPNMDGIALIAEVRKGESVNKDVPILVVTTEGGDSTKNSGKIAGASGWVVKPFNADVLVAAAAKLMSR